MSLLVDRGNTSAKWRLLDGNGVRLEQSREAGSNFSALFDLLSRLLSQKSEPKPELRVFFASVASSQLKDALLACLNSVDGLVFQCADVAVRREFQGLTIAYADKSKLGVDRWLAMLAAHRLLGGEFLLVSAGTAVTIDQVSMSGRHQGGLIAPGWGLLKSGLVDGTAQLGEAANIGLVDVEKLGVNTRECLERGVSAMLVAFVSSAITQFGAEVSTTMLTGGDAGKLAALLPFEVSVQENLVLDGLEVFAEGCGF